MNEPLAVRNKPAIKFVILMALALLALVVAAIKEPLQDMHWDVPIYLYQAKRFAETHYLANYARHAVEIVAQIQGGYPADEGYSESYWRFIRLGNIALIGVVVSLFGNTLAAISFLTWLYTLILVGGLAFCLSSVLMLGNSTDRTRPWFAGAAISALLFLLSDIYGYLAGNLVSEVLAIFLLSSAVVALLHSIRTRQRSWAMLSGLLAFVSYTARVESVWIWLTLLIAIAATRGSGGIRQAPWKPLLLAGLAAFLVFLVYAMIFHPLADPRNYLDFATAIAEKNQVAWPGTN